MALTLSKLKVDDLMLGHEARFVDDRLTVSAAGLEDYLRARHPDIDKFAVAAARPAMPLESCVARTPFSRVPS